MIFQEVVQALANMGFIDVGLPFILVFALTYGILQRTEVLGEKTNVMAMTAFVFAFISVAATSMLNVINLFISYFVILLMVGLLFAMLLGLAGVQEKYKNSGKILGGVLLALMAIGAFAILAATGIINAERFFTKLLIPLLVIAAIIFAVVYVLRSEGKEKKEPEKPKTQKISPEEKELVKKKDITKPKGTQKI